MGKIGRPGIGVAVLAAGALLAVSGAEGRVRAQAGESGEALYRATCANCHGADGRGAPVSRLAFDDPPMPDFTDCNFASREPDGDWIAVAHEGGPVRGFDRMMPAFGDARSVEELQRIMDHIRTFCRDGDWPRGELNLPRAMVTEKAYPEDEIVLTTTVGAEEFASWGYELVYEKRFGARNQFEIVVPYGLRERDAAAGGGWTGGLGDVALGVKRAVFHNARSGTILSVAGEVILPVGDEDDGFGKGTPVLEPFIAFGQILPADAFLHAQAAVEVPTNQDRAENEAVWRVALGRTITAGPWGRAWSPMVEVQGKRALESGRAVEWDLVPQFQVTLNTRQHVMANIAARVPLTDADVRETQLMVYLLLDWFDGGWLDGW